MTSATELSWHSGVVQEGLVPWCPGSAVGRAGSQKVWPLGTQGLCKSTLFFLQRRARSTDGQREVSEDICVTLRKKNILLEDC